MNPSFRRVYLPLLLGAFASVCDASPSPVRPLYSFEGGNDGYAPTAPMILLDNAFYGTTASYAAGGYNGFGTVFRFDPMTRVETVVYEFTGGNDGGGPEGGLYYANGLFYGTTLYGGTYGMGTVFSVDPVTGTEKVLHSFNGVDGAYPRGGVVLLNGLLYGGTPFGGSSNNGALYSVDPSSGAETVLHSFNAGADGSFPAAALTVHDNLLYGTTSYGGAGGGTLFTWDPATGTKAILHNFAAGNEGSSPAATLLYRDGVLYGSTQFSGASGGGVVFAIDASTGAETVLHAFAGGSDGSYPGGQLVLENGVLYGTTADGGAFDLGVAFSIDLATKVETVLYEFTGSLDGSLPTGGLSRYLGGLYGTSLGGGASFNGTIFRLRIR